MKSILFAAFLVGACVALTSPASGQQAGAPMRIGGTISPPTRTKDVAPVYPPEARQARISGVVILEAIVGEDGKVRSARVLRSIPELDQAAITAVQQWEYTPTLLNGVAVPIVMTVTVNFGLQGGPAAGLLPLSPNTLRLLTNRDPNGQVQVWDIDVTRVMALPRWNTDTDPPVSLSEAMRLARNWIARRNPQVERFVLLSATLLRRPLMPPEGSGEFWFYNIAYSRDFVPSMQSPPLAAIVLLDGSVLEPKEVPAPAVQAPGPVSGAPVPPGVTPPR